MPRSLRKLEPGGIYHVTARGNRKQRIFLADEDRELFLKLLARITIPLRWFFHAYCLMENHYHLVIETPEANLSAGVQRLNGRYAQAFNSAAISFKAVSIRCRLRAMVTFSNWHAISL